MNIGDLNKRITIQKLTSTVNENGFPQEKWDNYITSWSSVSNLNGREFLAAQAIQAEKTIKFIIRYTENIDETMRIFFKGKQYNITFIDDIKYSKTFMEIRALEVV